jgi:hypothetical protein
VEAGARLSFDMGGLSRCHLLCLDPSLAAVTAAAAITPQPSPSTAAGGESTALPRDAVTQDPYTVLSHAGSPVASLALNTGGFRFADIVSIYDANFLPGATKYGDLPTLLALTAPTPLWLAGEAVVNSHRGCALHSVPRLLSELRLQPTCDFW